MNGIQKFMFPGELGARRFAKIGLSAPEFLSPFVETFEVTCGILAPLGLPTRLAVIPRVGIRLAAITTTKIPILLESNFGKMLREHAELVDAGGIGATAARESRSIIAQQAAQRAGRFG